MTRFKPRGRDRSTYIYKDNGNMIMKTTARTSTYSPELLAAIREAAAKRKERRTYE